LQLGQHSSCAYSTGEKFQLKHTVGGQTHRFLPLS
jgi:hypothetical protein